MSEFYSRVERPCRRTSSSNCCETTEDLPSSPSGPSVHSGRQFGHDERGLRGHRGSNNRLDDDDGDGSDSESNESEGDGNQEFLRQQIQDLRRKFCSICAVSFNRRVDLQQHKFDCHRNVYFNSNDVAAYQQEGMGVGNGRGNNGLRFILRNSAFDVCREYGLVIGRNIFRDMRGLFTTIRGLLSRLMTSILNTRRASSFIIHSKVRMTKPFDNLTHDFFINSFCHRVLDVSMILPSISLMCAKMADDISTLTCRRSNWIVDRVLDFSIMTLPYNPLAGGSTYIEMPDALDAKNCVVNVKNYDDNMCFLWSICAELNPLYRGSVREKQRASNPSSYNNVLSTLDYDFLEFPVKIREIRKFERRNPQLSINVLSYEESSKSFKTKSGVIRNEGIVSPLYVSKNSTGKHIDLLLVGIKDIEGGMDYHYVLLKQSHENTTAGLSMLLAEQRISTGQRWYCYTCLAKFWSHETHERHLKLCSSNKPQRTIYPKADSFRFMDFRRSLKMHYVCYADFESILKPVMREMCMQGNECISDECELDHPQNTVQVSHHIACGFSFVIVDTFGSIVCHETYNGENAAKVFIDRIVECSTGIFEELKEKSKQFKDPPTLPPELEELKEDTIECFVCKQHFEDDQVKVQHHCHITNRFLGFCHEDCNLNAKLFVFLPVFFHNLSYDEQFLLQGINESHYVDKITSIPITHEKHLSLSIKTTEKNMIRFVDSIKFLPDSLEKLVETAKLEGTQFFRTMCENFQTRLKYTDEQLELLLRKGFYCYEYMSDFSKFDETKLPDRKYFYSSLSEKTISEEDYSHAQKVWITFGCKTIRDYHNLYVTTDVLLLCDIFEGFRKMSMEFFNLDPSHYVSLPGLSRDAGLIMSKTRIDYVKGEDMYNFCESSIRGGITQIVTKQAEVNNPLMGSLYNESKPTSWLYYVDACNLYGYALTQSLPFADFEWVPEEEITNMSTDEIVDMIMNLSDDASKGCFLEVDLEIPEDKHDFLSDFPPCPEREETKFEDLSQTSQNLFHDLGFSDTVLKHEKLVCSLKPKRNYILHYRTLKIYISLGVKLTKVHRILRFSQKRLFKSFVDFCSKKRAETISEFYRLLYKLIVNSFYGRLIMNKRKFKNSRFATSKKDANYWSKKPTLEDCEILFLGEMIIFYLSKLSVLLDSMVATGSAVLEISKAHMYDFHYGFTRKYYAPEHSRLCMTDTDSFIYIIITKDLYADLKRLYDAGEKRFDFSNYKNCKDSRKLLYTEELKGKVGLFKDEVSNGLLVKGIFLAPKLYCLLTLEELNSSRIIKTTKLSVKAKGICKTARNNHIMYEMFEKSLEEGITYDVNMTCIRSFKHQLYTIEVNKAALSSFDSKRYWLSNSSSLALGHKDTI